MKPSKLIDQSLVTSRLVGNETNALHLTNIVESNNPDKGIVASFDGLIELIQDLDCISASEHRQLPHCPVPPVVVPRRPVVHTVYDVENCEVFQNTKIKNAHIAFTGLVHFLAT